MKFNFLEPRLELAEGRSVCWVAGPARQHHLSVEGTGTQLGLGKPHARLQLGQPVLEVLRLLLLPLAVLEKVLTTDQGWGSEKNLVYIFYFEKLFGTTHLPRANISQRVTPKLQTSLAWLYLL